MKKNDACQKEIGSFGENAAERFLKRRFYRILARNYIAGKYEVDLIAESLRHVVFVEVKTRTQSPCEVTRFGTPSFAVTHQKRAFTVAAARKYLSFRKLQKQVRFDVIEIYLSDEETPKILKIVHMKDAYRAY